MHKHKFSDFLSSERKKFVFFHNFVILKFIKCLLSQALFKVGMLSHSRFLISRYGHCSSFNCKAYFFQYFQFTEKILDSVIPFEFACKMYVF